jgi:ABC-type lipoprotein export system ATPase subunit
MRIEKIYIKDIGPFEEKIIDFRDKWTGEISPRVLFSGPNGCGKTTVLNCISYLWKALGYWLYEKKELPKNDPARNYFEAKGCCAMLIDGIPDFSDKEGKNTKKTLIYKADNSFLSNIKRENEGIDSVIGELWTSLTKGMLGEEEKEQSDFFSNWGEEYKKLILSGSKSRTPNMVYLDAEERRWVKAEKSIGRPVQEDMRKRWLYKYEASKTWNTQLEASLITLKTTSLHKFHEIIRLLNTLLVNKEISPDIHPGENRLRVIIKNKRSTWHTFDQLSAGEREMLVLVYSIGRWMEEGGVVLVDEPDLFLHPGIMPDAFSAIEKLVEERKGQIIVTSHFPGMWERYENRAMRIKLDPGVRNE